MRKCACMHSFVHACVRSAAGYHTIPLPHYNIISFVCDLLTRVKTYVPPRSCVCIRQCDAAIMLSQDRQALQSSEHTRLGPSDQAVSDDRKLRPTVQSAVDENRLRQTIHDAADDRSLQPIARAASGDTRVRPNVHEALDDTRLRPTTEAYCPPCNGELRCRGSDLTRPSTHNPTRNIDQQRQCWKRTNSSCSMLVPSLKSSDSSVRRAVRRTWSTGGRSGTVVRFEEPILRSESWEVVSHEEDIATVESTDMDDSSESDEEAESSDGEEDTTSIERENTGGLSHSSSSRLGVVKHPSVVGNAERSCMTIPRKNSASEQRLFDVIDRAFNSALGWAPLVALPSDNPDACPNSSEKDNHDNSPTLNDTTEVRVTRLKRQCSCPFSDRRRQEEDTRILHHTSSLGELRPSAQLEGESSGGGRSCLDGGASRPRNPDHVAASGSWNKYKLFQRVSISSRIPRLEKSVIREHNRHIMPKSGCPSDITKDCQELLDQNRRQTATADKWDEFVGDMLSVHPCVQ